jgi:hypothetical protein
MPNVKTDRPAAILAFDPQGQSSRRGEEAAGLAEVERCHRTEEADLAERLGTGVRALRANGGRLYYHAEVVLAVEAAYRKGSGAGRNALLATICEYYEDGYGSGLKDGRATAEWAARRMP